MIEVGRIDGRQTPAFTFMWSCMTLRDTYIFVNRVRVAVAVRLYKVYHVLGRKVWRANPHPHSLEIRRYAQFEFHVGSV